MRTEKFSAAGKEFEFGFYWDRDRHYACVNVKVHVYVTLPKGYQKKLAKLAEDEERRVDDVELEIWDLAFTTEQGAWWEWARDRASELGLGEVFALGRQGGYLVVKRFTRSYIDEICDAVNRECSHCHEPYDRHVQGKCLFDHSLFMPAGADESYLKDLEDLRAYLREIGDSVKSTKALERAMVDQMKFYIDEKWEERRDAQLRRPRRAQPSGRADSSTAHTS